DFARARYREIQRHQLRRARAVDRGERGMRFLSRSDDSPPVRIRRRRRMQRRALFTAAAILVLAGSGGAAWYLERGGRLESYREHAQARIAQAGAELHLAVESVRVEGRRRADRQAILAALGVTRGTPIL